MWPIGLHGGPRHPGGVRQRGPAMSDGLVGDKWSSGDTGKIHRKLGDSEVLPSAFDDADWTILQPAMHPESGHPPRGGAVTPHVDPPYKLGPSTGQ